MRFSSELITISFSCFHCYRYQCEARDWWEVWCNDRSVSIYDLLLSCLFRAKQIRIWYQLCLMLQLWLCTACIRIVLGQSVVRRRWYLSQIVELVLVLVGYRYRLCKLITNVLTWWRIIYLCITLLCRGGWRCRVTFLCHKMRPGFVNDSDWLWQGWQRLGFSFYLHQDRKKSSDCQESEF